MSEIERNYREERMNGGRRSSRVTLRWAEAVVAVDIIVVVVLVVARRRVVGCARQDQNSQDDPFQNSRWLQAKEWEKEGWKTSSIEVMGGARISEGGKNGEERGAPEGRQGLAGVEGRLIRQVLAPSVRHWPAIGLHWPPLASIGPRAALQWPASREYWPLIGGAHQGWRYWMRCKGARAGVFSG
jgi:hypothetical protein